MRRELLCVAKNSPDHYGCTGKWLFTFFTIYSPHVKRQIYANLNFEKNKTRCADMTSMKEPTGTSTANEGCCLKLEVEVYFISYSAFNRLH